MKYFSILLFVALFTISTNILGGAYQSSYKALLEIKEKTLLIPDMNYSNETKTLFNNMFSFQKEIKFVKQEVIDSLLSIHHDGYAALTTFTMTSEVDIAVFLAYRNLESKNEFDKNSGAVSLFFNIEDLNDDEDEFSEASFLLSSRVLSSQIKLALKEKKGYDWKTYSKFTQKTSLKKSDKLYFFSNHVKEGIDVSNICSSFFDLNPKGDDFANFMQKEDNIIVSSYVFPYLYLVNAKTGEILYQEKRLDVQSYSFNLKLLNKIKSKLE